MQNDAPGEKLFQPTEHVGGFAFNSANPLLSDWINSWDGHLPLLDIGCGNSMNSRKAVESGASVIATEIDDTAIARQKHLYSQPEARQSNPDYCFARLPDRMDFADESFSGILCSEVFHFLDHPGVIASIWELFRLLKPGGSVVVTCACEDLKIFRESGIVQENAERRLARPLYFSPIEDYLTFLHKAASISLDQDDPAWEVIEQHHHCVPTSYFNVFNAQQLGMAFQQIGFSLDLCTTGPAPYYPLWDHGEQDQVRIVASRPRIN